MRTPIMKKIKSNIPLEKINETISLMKRMGENIDSSNFILYENNFKVPFIIKEGLIKSYPIGPVMSFISNAFNFKYLEEKNLLDLFGDGHNYSGQIFKEQDTQNACERIVIEVEDTFSKQEKLDFYMEKYGWFLSRVDGNQLIYEKKFNEYATTFQLLNHGVSCLYHVSSSEKYEKILRKGIQPKAKTNKNGYMHGERIYLFLNEPTEQDTIVTHTDEGKIIFEVDLTKVNETNKFYFDPRVRNALYTYEPISPNALKMI